MVDCFDGKVVSWSLSTRPDAELVNTMLDSAVETLNAGERPVIHSDRGGHYRWLGWLERVNAAGLIRSMCVFRSIRSRIGIEVRSAIRIHSINRELNFFYRFLTRFFAAFHCRGIFPQGLSLKDHSV